MTDKQSKVYNHWREVLAMDPTKYKITYCLNCGFPEADLKNSTTCISICQICRKGYCQVCLGNFDVPGEDIEALSDAQYNDLKREGNMLWHHKCYGNLRILEDWEDHIMKGEYFSCPKCGLGGRKDDACTHMTCPKVG